MSFPRPRFGSVQSAFQFDGPVGRDPARDEAIIQGVKAEFPNVVVRQLLTADAPPPAPHLVVTSTSSQLAISAVQAQFEVRFYGDYLDDIPRGIEYVERKLGSILVGLRAGELRPATVGVVARMQFPFPEGDHEQVEHVLATHLRSDVDPAEVQDALARIAVRVRDTYFVTLTVNNYETRVMERPIFPGLVAVAVKPWEGRLEEVGIELVIDINNYLEARQSGQTIVTEAGVGAVTHMLREIAMSAGPRFAQTGDLDLAELTASSRA
jgi:hypothetical protein